MAGHINRHFKPYIPVQTDEVIFSSGVTSINEIVALNLTDPGEGILLGMPIYGNYSNDLTIRSEYASLSNASYFRSTSFQE